MGKELNETFGQLKSALSSAAHLLSVKTDTKSRYDLYGKKKVTIGKKEFDGMFFASGILYKSYVGFYFFPIYTHPQEFADLPAELRKCLKGKSCFHIKKLDDSLSKSIRMTLKKGLSLYKRLQWI